MYATARVRAGKLLYYYGPDRVATGRIAGARLFTTVPDATLFGEEIDPPGMNVPALGSVVVVPVSESERAEAERQAFERWRDRE